MLPRQPKETSRDDHLRVAFSRPGLPQGRESGKVGSIAVCQHLCICLLLFAGLSNNIYLFWLEVDIGVHCNVLGAAISCHYLQCMILYESLKVVSLVAERVPRQPISKGYQTMREVVLCQP